MDAVSSILLRYLLQYRPVAVEGVGTLHTVRSSARFLPGQRLDPPRRTPELAATEPGDLPLNDLVAAELAVDPATADALCDEWYGRACARAEQAGFPSGSLYMEQIGTIRVDRERGVEFLADPEFLAMLNPLPAEPLAVPSPARRTGANAGRNDFRQRAGRPQRGRRMRPKGKNPHHYTVSFLAVSVVLAAAGYLCYYLWKHTDLFSAFLPR